MRYGTVAARADAFLDSDVLISLLAETHEQHTASLARFLGERRFRFTVSAHSYAETYSTLTRLGGPSPFGFSPREAWTALESVRAVTDLVGLTAAQTLEAVRGYAEDGGVGPRLNDRLIVEAAVAQGLPRIVTWNVAHVRGLFPGLTVATPIDLLAVR